MPNVNVPTGTLEKEFTAWVKEMDASFEKLWKTYEKPLYAESDADDAAPSSPSNADRAATVMGEHSDRLAETHKAMVTADTERKAYWRGPAASAFGDIIAAYQGFVDAMATQIAGYGRTTSTGVKAAHEDAQRQWGTLKSSMLDRWAYYRAFWYATLLGQANYLDRYANKASTTYATALQTYRANVANFNDGIIVIQADSKRDFESILATLGRTYEDARVAYLPFDTAPDFSKVKIVTAGADPNGKNASDITSALDKLTSQLGSGGGLGGADGPKVSGAGVDSGSLGLPNGTGGLGDLGGLPGAGSDPAGGNGAADGGLGGSGIVGGVPMLPSGTGLSPAALRAGKLVRTANGGTGLDLDGDGRADVGLDGRALPGGSAPEGSRLVTGPDGTVGYDISGNDIPDLALDLHPLRSGDLPGGSTLVTAADGTRAIDLNGDGIPDLTLDGRAIPGTAAPAGGHLATGPDGRTGFDLNGDGIPEVGFDGQPMGAASGQSPDPSGVVPGDQVRLSTDPAAVGQQAAGGLAYPPMMPPMMGGMGMGGMGGREGGERERQTWLQEDDGVWADQRVPVTALGRPEEEDDGDLVDEWVAPARQARPGARTRRTATPGGFQQLPRGRQ